MTTKVIGKHLSNCKHLFIKPIIMKSSIAKVIYLGILPAAGTYVLLFSMFHVELSHLYDTVMLSSESDTSFKLVGIIMCALTWFAAFQYWNFFIREYTVQMTQPEIEDYEDYHKSYYEGYTEDNNAEYDESYTEPEKVELNSPIKGLCRPFVLKHESYISENRGSWGNGYVLLSSEHPWSGRQADFLSHNSIWEISFSGTVSEKGLKEAGFEREIYENADQYWVFGFHTNEMWNDSTHNENWVKTEAIKLADLFRKENIEEVI